MSGKEQFQKCCGFFAEKQATRTKVSNAVVTAKAVASAKESKLWSDAGDNAIEYADKLEC